tara:strand:- start:296 stop:1402 length:1107 start_codon:yes stop_codon:yes gene_type:complete
MMNTVRFAIIGCGRIANFHADPIVQMEDVELVAASDLILERRQAFNDKYHVPTYENYHTMLQQENIDVVCILTPNGMHPAHAIDVISRYQKHVVVEKPLALAWEDLGKMKKAADRAGVKIFPIYQNRYNKAVQKVRADLQSGHLGKVALGTVRQRWCRPQRYYDLSSWRGTWAMDGGALVTQGIHFIDLLQYLLGDVESVVANIATQLVDVEVEDTAVAILKFKTGALGAIEITTAARPNIVYENKLEEASISILSEYGMSIITGIAANELSTYTSDLEATEAHTEKFNHAYGTGHIPLLRDVVADIRHGIPHPISFEDGIGAIRLLNAIYRSAEDGREVYLSEELTSHNLGHPDQKLIDEYTVFPEK